MNSARQVVPPNCCSVIDIAAARMMMVTWASLPECCLSTSRPAERYLLWRGACCKILHYKKCWGEREF